MKDKELLMELLIENECLLADGYEEALIGITKGVNPVAVYDADKCIKIVMEEHEMSQQDASEYFYYNTVGSYVGDKNPIYI